MTRMYLEKVKDAINTVRNDKFAIGYQKKDFDHGVLLGLAYAIDEVDKVIASLPVINTGHEGRPVSVDITYEGQRLTVCGRMTEDTIENAEIYANGDIFDIFGNTSARGGNIARDIIDTAWRQENGEEVE